MSREMSMYLNIPAYKKAFSPTPEGEWERIDDNRFVCAFGRANLVVFRFAEGKPWWAECDNPEFESATWFYTPEQAQYWAEKELRQWCAA